MSVSANHLTIKNLVINTIPNNGMALLPAAIPGLVPAKDTSWAKMQANLAKVNKFPEARGKIGY